MRRPVSPQEDSLGKLARHGMYNVLICSIVLKRQRIAPSLQDFQEI